MKYESYQLLIIINFFRNYDDQGVDAKSEFTWMHFFSSHLKLLQKTNLTKINFSKIWVYFESLR